MYPGHIIYALQTHIKNLKNTYLHGNGQLGAVQPREIVKFIQNQNIKVLLPET